MVLSYIASSRSSSVVLEWGIKGNRCYMMIQLSEFWGYFQFLWENTFLGWMFGLFIAIVAASLMLFGFFKAAGWR